MRFLKQLIIASLFFIILGSGAYYFLKGEPEPVSEPSILIEPPTVISQQLLKVNNFDYDFIIEIKNPNIEFGATDVSYELSLFDEDDNLVEIKSGNISLLPNQTRYEVISPLEVEREIFDHDFKITGANWQKLKGFIPQNIFSVKSQNYSSLSSGDGFSKLEGAISNISNFDFDRADVFVLLFNESNEILAVNKTDIRTFLSKTDRFFQVKWINPFVGNVARIEVFIYSDVFKNDNFIEDYGTQEKFQNFY